MTCTGLLHREEAVGRSADSLSSPAPRRRPGGKVASTHTRPAVIVEGEPDAPSDQDDGSGVVVNEKERLVQLLLEMQPPEMIPLLVRPTDTLPSQEQREQREQQGGKLVEPEQASECQPVVVAQVDDVPSGEPRNSSSSGDAITEEGVPPLSSLSQPSRPADSDGWEVVSPMASPVSPVLASACPAANDVSLLSEEVALERQEGEAVVPLPSSTASAAPSSKPRRRRRKDSREISRRLSISSWALDEFRETPRDTYPAFSLLATLLDTEAFTTASGQPRILCQLMQLQGSAMDALFGFHKQLLRQRAPLLAEHFERLMIEPQLYLVEVSHSTCHSGFACSFILDSCLLLIGRFGVDFLGHRSGISLSSPKPFRAQLLLGSSTSSL